MENDVRQYAMCILLHLENDVRQYTMRILLRLCAVFRIRIRISFSSESWIRTVHRQFLEQPSLERPSLE
jgi:hypothetical protein